MSYPATNNLNDLVETAPLDTELVDILGQAFRETRRTFKAVVLKEHNPDGTHASVNGAVLVDNTVPLTKLVGGTALGAGSVDTTNIADKAVTAAKIADGTITATQITDKIIPASKLLGVTSAALFVVQPDGSLSEKTMSGGATLDHNGVLTLAAASVGQAIALFAEIEATGSDGGTFTSGSWRTRVLNSTIIDSSAIFNLSANTLTWSTPGTYYIKAEAVGNVCGLHQVRLWDNTNSVVIAEGMPADAIAEMTPSSVETVLTVAPGVTQTMQLLHQCQTTRATNGLGLNPGFTSANTVFSRITIIKLI